MQVCDFNLARALKSEMVEPSATLNSPAWSAPERLQGKRYGKSADVFSFGVILWELITLGTSAKPHPAGLLPGALLMHASALADRQLCVFLQSIVSCLLSTSKAILRSRCHKCQAEIACIGRSAHCCEPMLKADHLSDASGCQQLCAPELKCFAAGVPWRDMAEDGSVADDGRDNFYYVLNNVIEGKHLPCPASVQPTLPELPQVSFARCS